jgi:formylglycine-generating enzyme required for sulfatase activity
MVDGVMAGQERSLMIARQQIELFEEEFPEAIAFACHAAFPLTLTTELVYYLRQRFFPGLDWSVAPELLLSGLCDAVGYDLYDMSLAVRGLLLDRLVKDYGELRLEELAAEMGAYIEARLQMDSPGRARGLGYPPEVTKWTALSLLNPDLDVTERIKQALAKALADCGESPQDLFRLAEFVRSHGDLLALQGFNPVTLDELEGMAQRIRSRQSLEDVPERMQAVMAAAGFPRLEVKQVESVTLVEAIEAETNELKSFSFEVVTVDDRGEEIDRRTAQANYYIETLPKGLNLEMVAIPGGTFMMGAPESERGSDDNERPQHEVTVAPFFMGKYAVTQAQWRSVVALPQIKQELDLNPAYSKGDNLPVENVSWLDAEEFCLRLSVATGRTYCLPSEAEWEYACRARTQTPFHFGDTLLSNLAKFDARHTYANSKKGLYRGQTSPVNSFMPNVFGLYNMHGNVYEWCLDRWFGSYSGAPTDGSSWLSNNGRTQRMKRVLTHQHIKRGGCWISSPRYCRAAVRSGDYPDYSSLFNGFRVVCVAPPEAP